MKEIAIAIGRLQATLDQGLNTRDILTNDGFPNVAEALLSITSELSRLGDLLERLIPRVERAQASAEPLKTK